MGHGKLGETMPMPRSAALNAEPNVTPMIDVLLVVLIVFMVAMVRVYHTMDVQLPEACSGVCDASQPIVLEVLPGPTYRINRQAVAAADVLVRLRSIYGPRPDKIIQVAGHPAVRYSDVFAAMDVAKAAGVREIGIVPKDIANAR
jgi:biopolymer transport protein TolR